MLKIDVKPDCENAPKKQLLRDFSIAFSEENIPFILDRVTDDIHWRIVGDKVISGKPAFAAALEEMKGVKTTGLTIHRIITHGAEAAVDGEVIVEDGKKYAFCDVYLFAGARGDRIKALTSYVIAL